jgi:hypothetical protein
MIEPRIAKTSNSISIRAPNWFECMKTIAPTLAVFGLIALFALSLAAPALADSGGQYSQYKSHDGKRAQLQKRRRDRKRQRIDSSPAHYGYFGADPDRYFGIGPGSYDCYGYDCNW